jgi:hypothetical protein
MRNIKNFNHRPYGLVVSKSAKTIIIRLKDEEMNLPALKLATERLQKVLDPTANKEEKQTTDPSRTEDKK